MAAIDAQSCGRPVAIAPAPTKASPTENGDSADHTMPYACQTCTKRKVKCNKTTPICSSCRKAKVQCFYQAPPPRRRGRLIEAQNEKIARYGRILRQHGLLSHNTDALPTPEETPDESTSLRFQDTETARTGELLASEGKARYIDSILWRDAGDGEIQRTSDEEEEDEEVLGSTADLAWDPLTGAFMGSQQSLLPYHPTHEEAMMLWNTHVENVEPICKVLHIPSTSSMVETTSQQPETASKAEECLLFAIYHFAVFSMSEEECAKKLGQSRASLLQNYQVATRQALVNAYFLRTTEISILQALVLFLIPCRHYYDPHTYWILTGVAIRIAQRMGIHKDGEKLGLPPFDVQMRRRLFHQLLPLDGIASRMSGTGIGAMPDSWDTQLPLNINDDQMWPGMTETPDEQKGATEMIFCLARSCIGKSFVKTGATMQDGKTKQFRDINEAENLISEAEREVEEKYIRYCDIVNPLHFLTIASARSAITSIRIRTRLPKVRNKTVTDAERRELFQFSQKIMDTDTAACTNTGLRKFRWYVGPFFVWGTWDSLIFVLTSLRRADLLTSAETETAWSKVENMYNNHNELLESKQGLHLAVRRLTLKAWDANPPTCSVPEPAFITALRSLRKASRQVERQDTNATTLDAKMETMLSLGPSPESDTTVSSSSLLDGMDLEMGSDLNVDTADWMFWDQLIRDYQMQGAQ